MPHRLLRQLLVVDAPTRQFAGAADRGLVLRTARQGGLLLYVLAADQDPGLLDAELLGEACAAAVTVYVAMVPDLGTGRRHWPSGGGSDRAATALRRHREAALLAVPTLSAASWFIADIGARDVAPLRRALVEWAAAEGLRRVGTGLSAADARVPSAAGFGACRVRS